MLAREPDALAAHVRFDEGSVETGITVRLFRHRQTKGADNRYDEPNVHRATLLLYHLSTRPLFNPNAARHRRNAGTRLLRRRN